MKKLLILIVLIAVGIGVWHFVHNNSTSDKNTVLNSNPIVNGHPDASNGTFKFEDGPVTLKNGSSVTSIPDSGLKVETDLSDTLGYGDLNADGKEDVVVILTQSGGGSGTFSNLAAYVSGPISYKGTNTVFIGDRVLIKSVIIKGSKITVSYLDRKDGEPMAADPTVLTNKTFIYSSLDNSIEGQ